MARHRCSVRRLAPNARFTQSFPATRDELWDALVGVLPGVTKQVAFYEDAHRVEWTIDTTGFTWAQSMSASAEAAAGGGSVLSIAGKTAAWPSLLASGKRKRAFRALSDSVAACLAQPPAQKLAPRTDGDRYRYWNGTEWSADPPA